MVSVKAQKFAGLADTPPRGWNSWNRFARNLWTKKDEVKTNKSREVTIEGHEVLLYKLSPDNQKKK